MRTSTLVKISIIILAIFVAFEGALLIARFVGYTVQRNGTAKAPKQEPTVVMAPKDRIDEVKEMTAALKAYSAAHNGYPETLQDLIPKYMKGPKDPSVGFSQYIYVPIGKPVDTYTLTYTLSDTYSKLEKGKHVAGPSGLQGGEYPLSGSDLDNDGLDDNLEIYVYHTDSQNADTDGDGFSDGVEVSSGHNPLGK
jgi:hypothetical protein